MMNIIVSVKNRLISVDSILPVLMELKSRIRDVRIFVITTDQDNFEVLSRNTHIVEAIRSVGSRLIFPPRKNRLLLVLWCFFFLLRFSFRRNLILKAGNCLPWHRRLVGILKKISRTREVFYVFLPPMESFLGYLKKEQRVFHGDSGLSPKSHLGCDADLVISSFDYAHFSDLYEDKVDPAEYMNIGYVRDYPEWNSFISKQESPAKKPYCVFILSTLGKRINSLNEPPLQEMLVETLECMKRFSGEMHTVFRPHFITDMRLLDKTLKDTGYTNYSIDYSHPSVLFKNAQFAISNYYSNTLADAAYLGCPVIEYSSIDSRLPQESPGGAACNYHIADRDREKLESTICSLLKGGSRNVSYDGSRQSGLSGNFKVFEKLVQILDSWQKESKWNPAKNIA